MRQYIQVISYSLCKWSYTKLFDEDRVALIVAAWQPGWEEMENLRGNDNSETLSTSPLSLPLFPPSLSTPHPPHPCLSLALHLLFLSSIPPISGATRPDLRHLPRLSKILTYELRGNNSGWSQAGRKGYN